MKQKIFLIILVLVLLIGGRSIVSNFMVNHQYYNTMFGSMSNWWMIIWAIIAALIPVGYLFYSKKINIKKSLIALGVGLLLFAIASVAIKDSTIQTAGFVLLIINVCIIFGLGVYSIASWTAAGSFLMRRLLGLDLSRWQNMLLAFGMGMAAMMLIVHFLVVATIFYPIFARLLFVLGGVAIWYERDKSFLTYKTILEDGLANFQRSSIAQNKRLWIGVVLLVMSIMYFYYGFQLSFIPYSTAWDANHAYLYWPKVWAENAGALGYGQPGGAGGQLWLSYITFFFSLIQPIKSWFWLSADNIAVSMNFLSGLFVLIFGLGLVKEVVGYIISTIKTKSSELIKALGLYTGWIGLLLWMTSGMGAFLVFVDNKTDMGLLAMSVLALLSGIVFLRYIHEHKKQDNQQTINTYITVSGLFFAVAVASKPTAMIDVVIFGLFMIGLWINSGIAIGFGMIVMAILAKMQVLFTGEFITPDAFIPLLVAGIMVIVASVFVAIKQHRDIADRMRYTIDTLLRWGIVVVAAVLLIKGPYLIIESVQSGNFSVGQFAKGLLMGQNTVDADKDTPVLLLAQEEEMDVLEEQNMVDRQFAIDPAMCSMDSLGWTDEDLDQDTKKFEGGNTLSEDVGRYVGFGWHEFSQGLGYSIASVFMGQEGKCYGFNKAAKMLCNYEDAINDFDLAILYDLVEELPKNSQGYTLLHDALGSEKVEVMLATDSFNPAQMRDEIVQIRQRYQGRSFKVRDDSLMVPYRYIVPWNAVFNRSLQNLSSYYTDIGFVRGILILLQIVGLIYAIAVWNHRLLVLSSVTFVGWSIWWLIAGGIVWYGIGLIVRSILTSTLFLVTLLSQNKDETDRKLGIVVIGLLLLWITLQFLMNFIRISSQGGGGPFVWYKMSAGMTNTINTNLGQEQTLTIPYTRDNVFDLQFAHYNKFINHVKDRPDEDGVAIAGTYLQYFLHNQRNVGSAGKLYELTSDGNTCKSYLRLQREQRKYIVIDPNILSVVMGEGNESLMHRFFARRDPVTGRIQDDGEMTMLVRMWYDGYIDLFSTNNLGAKYAFLLSDEKLMQAFNISSRDDLVFLRAKMGVARFFPDAEQIISFIGNTLVERIGNGQAVGDIADVFGKIIDEGKVLSVMQQVLNAQGNPAQLEEVISELTQDERFILSQYLGIYNMLRQNSPQFGETINQILSQSVASSSQIIVFELQ